MHGVGAAYGVFTSKDPERESKCGFTSVPTTCQILNLAASVAEASLSAILHCGMPHVRPTREIIVKTVGKSAARKDSPNQLETILFPMLSVSSCFEQRIFIS